MKTLASHAAARETDGIQEQRHWEELPELAKALAVAGCVDSEILDHLRMTDRHSTHCWVVDLLLAHASDDFTTT